MRNNVLVMNRLRAIKMARRYIRDRYNLHCIMENYENRIYEIKGIVLWF